MPKSTTNAGGNALTVAPVHAMPAHVASQDPEFLDAKGIEGRFGLKRSLLYTLLGEGAIRGVSLRRRGSKSGKRLIDVSSVRVFLHSQMEEGVK
jgi:hypothetical protein